MAKTARRATRGLAAITSKDLQRELRRRQKLAARLARKRDKLLARAAELDRQIADYHGTSGVTVRVGSPRGGRSSTLAGALAAALKGKTLTVTEMPEAVRAAGYESKAKNFRTMINAALLKHTDLFRRVSRGMYTAK